ncbi:hypothetical protein [Ascidiimonas aurantiaca]|uniref:hypothetical protein n=1 Tax=Ascidiimonas aurantiaca TaxID=1685432 RepID=UPI0030EE8519
MFSLLTGVIITVYYQAGFSMSRNGTLEPGLEGYEYHLLALAVSIQLYSLVGSSGRFSIDHCIYEKNNP